MHAEQCKPVLTEHRPVYKQGQYLQRNEKGANPISCPVMVLQPKVRDPVHAMHAAQFYRPLSGLGNQRHCCHGMEHGPGSGGLCYYVSEA
jgi:hypothetical protein